MSWPGFWVILLVAFFFFFFKEKILVDLELSSPG